MKRKGRDNELIRLRNEKIVERYAYLHGVLMIRQDESLRILSEEEFFLSQRHIWRIIKEARGVLSRENLERLKKPQLKTARGVPHRVRYVAEYDQTLFH